MLKEWKVDLIRYFKVSNCKSLKSKIKAIMNNEPIFYLLLFRLGNYYKNNCKIPVIREVMYFFIYFFHKITSIIMGIQIPLGTKISQGLYLPHYGTIVIHRDTIIGEHCNVGQGVTIGIAGRGEKQGVPKIGNFVYIAPGAKIIGKIDIGNNVMIGANSVVTKSIPDNAVVAGVPAKIISYRGWEVEGNVYNK